MCLLLGPGPHSNSNYRILSKFLEVFTLLEPVSLVKVFRLFRLEQIFFVGVQSVDMAGRCTTSYLLAGPACL